MVTPWRSHSSMRRTGSQQLSLDLAEELAVDVHAGAAGAVLFQLHESAVAVSLRAGRARRAAGCECAGRSSWCSLVLPLYSAENDPHTHRPG